MGKRLAILISGNGSNLQAIIDAVQTGELDAQIVVVVTNRRAAYGLVRAAQAGIPTLYFPLKPYTETGRPRVAYDADLARYIMAYAPDLIVLAGWMHVFTAAFLDRFAGRVLNLHPALPGRFPGIHGIRESYEAFQRGEEIGSGIMVHWVVPDIDAGPVIASMPVPIYPADRLEEFETRIHAAEHRLLVEAIRSVI